MLEDTKNGSQRVFGFSTLRFIIALSRREWERQFYKYGLNMFLWVIIHQLML